MTSELKSALRSDLSSVQQRNRRVTLITDGLETRLVAAALAAMIGVHGKEQVAVDVISKGPKNPGDEEYSRMVQDGKGKFLRLSEPEQVGPTVEKYLRPLAGSMMPRTEVFGPAGTRTLHQGETISFASRLVTVLLPQFRKSGALGRIIENVKVSSDKTTSLHVGVPDGTVRVRPPRDLQTIRPRRRLVYQVSII